MPRKAVAHPVRAVGVVTALSWLDWKRSCHQLLNARMAESPDLAGASRRGSLHALLGVLLDHCSSQKRMSDGRCVCWPAIEGTEPGRDLREWLGHSGRDIRRLVGILAGLKVIDVQYSPKSSASHSRHNGSLLINGARQKIGLVNAYVLAVPYAAAASDDAPAVVASPASPSVAAPRPVPMRPRVPRAAPWYRVGNVPDLPKGLREEWDRTLGREQVTAYLRWLAETWGERRSEDEAFAFHKRERGVWRQQRTAAVRGAAAQQHQTDTHQQVQARLAKRAEAHG